MSAAPALRGSLAHLTRSQILARINRIESEIKRANGSEVTRLRNQILVLRDVLRTAASR